VNGDALESALHALEDERGSHLMPAPAPGEPASSGQQGVPVAVGGPASDGSQPYARLPSSDSSQPHARVAALHGSGQIVASVAGADSRPVDPRQSAGQSTMLGVAPPPQGWRPPKGADSGLHGAPHSPPAPQSSPVQPSPSMSTPQSGRRHTPELRNASTLPRPALEEARSPLRTALQIALVLMLCAGAAVGGYFIVLAIFGG
jgi:hypothetical protein